MSLGILSPVRHYQVALPEFEGPLDVLLRLIEKAQLDITKIALAQITDQFLAYVETLQDRSPEEVSAFLVVAARLLQIKSEALLPRPSQREEEEEDPGELLVRQLRLYRQFKQAAAWMRERMETGEQTFPGPGAATPVHPALLDLEGLTLEDIVRAARRVLLPNHPFPSRVLKLSYIPLRDLMHSLLDTLREVPRLSFFQWLQRRSRRDRALVSAAFLALLELVKQRRVVARQPELFGDIWVEPRKPKPSQ